MRRKKHGNSLENENIHHLYAIKDKEVQIDENQDDVVKYGISEKPLNSNGESPRANEQVTFLNNAVGKIRFYAEVLIEKIANRILARKTEDEYIKNYENKYGKSPRGNQ